MSVHLSIARAAQQSPERPAVRGDGYERTWAQTADRVARLAGGLRSAGLKSGDRLALLAGNSVEHMELTYAAIWAGIVVVPMNTRLSSRELINILLDSGAAALAFDRQFAATGSDVAAQAGIGLTVGWGQACSKLEFDQLLAADSIEPYANRPDELLGIYYTGGTTGVPKGVELSHLTFHLAAIDQAIGMEVDHNSVYLHGLPFFHLADCSVGNSVTYRQGVHVFVNDSGPAAILRAINQYGVNTLNLVPTMYADLIEYAGGDSALAQVVDVVYGAAPVSEGLLRKILDAFPRARLKQAFGQTEIGGACVILPPEAHSPGDPRLAFAGRATMSAHIRIAAPDGSEQPRGQAGEILVAGPRIMRGYRGMPKESSETITNGWLHTGDVGVMNDEGFIAVVDRLKDMIVTGGENVFCGEVENVLSIHPEVAVAVVVGVPDPRWGEAVHAFVVPCPGTRPSVESLIEHCRGSIAHYKCPKMISFVDELPKSAIGKIRKDILRESWIRENK